MAAVAGKFGMGEGLSGERCQHLHDLKRLLVDHQHLVLVRTEEDIGPEVGAGRMAAQEEARPVGLYLLDQRPVVHVDDRNHALVQMRGGHDAVAVAFPGDARAQMRHPRQRQLGDLAPDIEVDDHALVALSVGADQVAVIGGEEEIVQRFIGQDAAAGEQPFFGAERFLHVLFIAVHETVMEGAGLGVGGDLPDLGGVLERQHEGLAIRCLIDRRDPAFAAVAGHDRDDLLGREVVGRQDGQARRQVIRHREPFAVMAHGDIAAVQRGADAADFLQRPDVVFLHPAVAGHDEDIAPVGAEFRPTMNGEGGGEAVQHLERVAVEHADMMIAGFHDKGDVQRIRAEDRRLGGPVIRVHLPAFGHLFGRPFGMEAERRGHIVDQPGNLIGAQLVGKTGHLGRGTALGDHRIKALHPPQRFGDQRRAGAAKAILAMAGGAVIGEIGGGIGPGGQRQQREKTRRNDAPDHGFFPGKA